jgi:hypothetical protein
MVQFLRDRLAEDEQEAQWASDGPWWVKGEEPEHWGDDRARAWVECSKGIVAELGSRARGVNGPHIARQDPARTLRRVANYREIIDEWAENHEAADAESHNNSFTGRIDTLGWFVIPRLAAEYDTHPDYQEEWRS